MGRNAGGRVVVQINKASEGYLNSLGASNSPEMRAAAQELKKKIRKVLGIKGQGKPAPAGQPPREQTGRLKKSVKDGPVGAVRRVAVTEFYASMQQFGVRSKKLTIEDRPFMEESLKQAQDGMAEQMVTAMQQRAPSTTL